jgi:peptidoglycan/xylan/chitin deacetylase (PgdA/CDA1 family)
MIGFNYDPDRATIQSLKSSINMSKTKFAVFAILLILIAGVGCGFFYVYQNRYSTTWALFIKPLYRFETNEKIVALTFDDGPNSVWTPLLLDLLKKHSVKATFFVIGKHAEKNKGIIQRAIREGHVIGNHTYNHDLMIFHSYSFIKNDLEKTDTILSGLGVSNTSFFRPPSGEKMILLPLVLKNMNKVLVMWDVTPHMEQFITKRLNNSTSLSQYVADISQNSIEKCRIGSIILLHDGWYCNLEPLLKAVEQIIISLKNKGFRFVTIQEGIDISRGQSHS